MDTSLMDVDVQPTYARVSVKGKVLRQNSSTFHRKTELYNRKQPVSAESSFPLRFENKN